MNLRLIFTLAQLEMRLRMRRLSTVFAVLIVIAITWTMVLDPKTGQSMLVIQGARTLYTSSTLALGSATLCAMLMGLIGFYLVRGRMLEDLRSGTGGVIAATPVSSSLFLIGRWLGGVAYLSTLCCAVMLTMLIRHAVTGDGPIQLWVYLQNYVFILLPLISFCTSFAILFDSLPFFIGKLGEVTYFFIWMFLIPITGEAGRSIPADGSLVLGIDFLGMCNTSLIILHHLGTTHFAMGGGTFNPQLPTKLLPEMLWWPQLIYYRLLCLSLSLLPLLPASLFFHRFSPDRVKASASNPRRSPLMLLNQYLRPLARFAQPVFALSAQTPGLAGQVIAELALSMVAAPLTILALIALPLTSVVLPAEMLANFSFIAVLVWLLLMPDFATRDYQADTENLNATVSGGIRQRYLRQFFSALVLGICLMGMLIIRLYLHHSTDTVTSATAMLFGIISLSAMATMLGRCTRTARTFLAFSLLWLYLAHQAADIKWLDIMGFNGMATAETILWHSAIGAVLGITGYLYNRQQAS